MGDFAKAIAVPKIVNFVLYMTIQLYRNSSGRFCLTQKAVRDIVHLISN